MDQGLQWCRRVLSRAVLKKLGAVMDLPGRRVEVETSVELVETSSGLCDFP